MPSCGRQSLRMHRVSRRGIPEERMCQLAWRRGRDIAHTVRSISSARLTGTLMVTQSFPGERDRLSSRRP